MFCNCKSYFDIRVMCHSKLIGKDGQKKWKRCPFRVETTLWHLQNDYDVYKQLEPYEDTYNELHQTYLCNGNTIAGKRHPVFKIIRAFCKTNRLTTEESNELIKQFLIEKYECNKPTSPPPAVDVKECVCCYESTSSYGETCRQCKSFQCEKCIFGFLANNDVEIVPGKEPGDEYSPECLVPCFICRKRFSYNV